MEVWPDELLPVDDADVLPIEPACCHECGTPIRVSRRGLRSWAAGPHPGNPRREWVYRCWCGMSIEFCRRPTVH
jgi:hypothetical protein